MVERSLETDGFGRSILLDAAGNIIAGNGVTEAAGNVGIEDVLIVPSDGTRVIAIQRTDVEPGSERAVRLAIADNRAQELSDFDPAVVAALADEVDLSDFWRDDELNALLAGIETEQDAPGDDPGAQMDRGAALAAEYGVEPNQLWTLGAHRLIVGDCTDGATIDRLMDGRKANMVFTDPPYNTGMQQGRTASDWGVVENDDLSVDDYRALLRGTQKSVAAVNDGDVYLCCDYRCYTTVVETFGMPRSCIVWAKENFGLGSGYRRQHEFIAYWGRFAGNTESDLWEQAKDRGTEYQHPMQKPPALAGRAMENSSVRGDVVLDCFAGSGSTLIAAEQTGRICYAAEIEPKYAAVAIKRWADMTGLTPRLVARDGTTD
jgi:DNA modification methylase